jgi:hypothetical protein
MKGSSAIYRPLSEIIDEALLDSQDGIHWRERYTRWAIKYAEEIFQDGWCPQIKTIEVEVKPWKAIQLPADCYDWIFVGVRNGHDVMTFIHDRTIATVFDKDEEGLKEANATPEYQDGFVPDPTLSDTVVPFYNLINNFNELGENRGQLYGLLVKENGLGYFTENKNKDVSEIQFKFNLASGTKVYLMYITTGFEPNGETMIHPDYAEYIVAGIHRERQSKSRDKSGLAWTEKEFERQQLRMLDKKWIYSTEDITEYIKSGYSSTPKK